MNEEDCKGCAWLSDDGAFCKGCVHLSDKTICKINHGPIADIESCPIPVCARYPRKISPKTVMYTRRVSEDEAENLLELLKAAMGVEE